MKKSYKQNCSLAHALDVIGDRWTLLIIRELMIGTRRYGELADNLSGIGTNLLASRLKEMENNGLISKAPQGYSLTESGKRIEPIIMELIRFGLGLGIKPQKDYLTRPEWDGVALRALYRPEIGSTLDGRHVLDLDNQPFLIDIQGHKLSISAEDFQQPLVRVKLKTATARRLSSGKLSFSDGVSKGLLKVDGNQQKANQLLQAFGLIT